jgi:hypothetical protein
MHGIVTNARASQVDVDNRAQRAALEEMAQLYSKQRRVPLLSRMKIATDEVPDTALRLKEVCDSHTQDSDCTCSSPHKFLLCACEQPALYSRKCSPASAHAHPHMHTQATG